MFHFNIPSATLQRVGNFSSGKELATLETILSQVGQKTNR